MGVIHQIMVIIINVTDTSSIRGTQITWKNMQYLWKHYLDSCGLPSVMFLQTFKTLLTEWDHREVQWFDSLNTIWEEAFKNDPRELIAMYSEPLKAQLDLPMAYMDPAQSKFFKQHYRSNWHNQGVMIREMDVIRRQEGW